MLAYLITEVHTSTSELYNWSWYYEEILENFSEIRVKLGKDYEEILEKLWKNIGNT